MRINYRISPSFCLWTWASKITGSLATMIQTYVLWQTPILIHLRLPTKETLSTRGKRESVSHSWPQPKPKVSVHFSRFPENRTAQKAKYDEMHETTSNQKQNNKNTWELTLARKGSRNKLRPLNWAKSSGESALCEKPVLLRPSDHQKQPYFVFSLSAQTLVVLLALSVCSKGLAFSLSISRVLVCFWTKKKNNNNLYI